MRATTRYRSTKGRGRVAHFRQGTEETGVRDLCRTLRRQGDIGAMNTETCGTGSCQIIGALARVSRRRSEALSESTVLARIMTALDHADAWLRSQVFDVLNARGVDGELSAGDVLQVCTLLDLPAAVILGTVRDDLRSVQDAAG